MSFHRHQLPARWLLDLSREVSNETGVSQADILGRRRLPEHVRARRIVMRMAYDQGRCKSEIARALGLDWTTVHAGLEATQ